ncbi:sodium/glutamate symporter [Treponema phagedenis]|uniref:Sodium/glutamate symporter n=1 Tax=Treponema phagedenis TaxID=162 RepID=A0A0B7GUP9_TREPH|nr:sodium/glutamate symporter [Treponema phagedenis]NVP25014.1 sodium/glutamate symporter [Treponema phagedenis]QEJ94072.1 sodium/glutamate symporter [Treponema phagedenis]QEJ97128.1 sodium/glutamate symporter [Treponema phagedenis]QEK01918.1 sodium/glutamate symporter [Treponema phagedenis]QEK02682.1 sodium/glutamate symporter [Treponema phagedenis]
MKFEFNMYLTLGLAIVLYLFGDWIKSKVSFFRKYYIPAPVIGGVLFSICMLIGHNTGAFEFTFNTVLKDFFMVVFFTSVGFLASLNALKKGGIAVVLFLIAALVLVLIQNGVGVALAKIFGLNPGIGLAAGSIPLTGGHGTSGAFGPYLEERGVAGATVVAFASATYGLVMGCMIGGPIAKQLMKRNNLVCTETGVQQQDEKIGEKATMTEASFFKAACMVGIAMGIGAIITPLVKNLGLSLPVYLVPMLVAAIIRNIIDATPNKTPVEEIGIIGNVCLAFFLAIALMTMKLWELAGLAVPLVVILLVQTVIMALYAYFVTFNIMGRDYDAAVMATGHCGFGMGATPNAIANMRAFTEVNGFSTKAFLAVPLVGSLFIDPCNAIIIQTFTSWFVG